MMWKKYCTTAFATATMLAGTQIVASELKKTETTDEKIFAETIKNVDTGGKMLQYYNTQQLGNQIRQMVALLKNIAKMDPTTNSSPMLQIKMQIAFQVLDELIEASGVECFKSYAVSEKLAEDGMYITKTFAYTDNDPQGLIFKIAEKNRPFNKLKNIPKSSNLAIGAQVDAFNIYQAIKAEAKKNADKDIAAMPMKLENEFYQNTGKYLIDILKSASGEYQLIVKVKFVEKQPTAQVVFRIPNNNNFLGEFLETNLDMAMKSNKAIYKEKDHHYKLIKDATMPDWLNPRLVITKDEIVFTTDTAFLAECMNNKDTEYAQKIIDGLNIDKQDGGLSYVIAHFDKKVLNDVKALLPPQITQMFNAELDKFSELKFYSLDYRLKNGFKSVVKCNYELGQFQSYAAMQLPIMAGVLLPALNAAQMKAMQINQAAQMKMQNGNDFKIKFTPIPVEKKAK
ncbi:hypothetical protein AAEX28_08355 [Lentisphaerota bacterium WC36G]|nr:hypothetical protein LJT99_11210 [Lentisphaerae bacterium WC36]